MKVVIKSVKFPDDQGKLSNAEGACTTGGSVSIRRSLHQLQRSSRRKILFGAGSCLGHFLNRRPTAGSCISWRIYECSWLSGMNPNHYYRPTGVMFFFPIGSDNVVKVFHIDLCLSLDTAIKASWRNDGFGVGVEMPSLIWRSIQHPRPSLLPRNFLSLRCKCVCLLDPYGQGFQSHCFGNGLLHGQDSGWNRKPESVQYSQRRLPVHCRWISADLNVLKTRTW